MITLLLQNVMKSRPLKLVQYTSRNKNIQMGTDKRSANRSEPENKRFSSVRIRSEKFGEYRWGQSSTAP